MVSHFHGALSCCLIKVSPGHSIHYPFEMNQPEWKRFASFLSGQHVFLIKLLFPLSRSFELIASRIFTQFTFYLLDSVGWLECSVITRIGPKDIPLFQVLLTPWIKGKNNYVKMVTDLWKTFWLRAIHIPGKIFPTKPRKTMSKIMPFLSAMLYSVVSCVFISRWRQRRRWRGVSGSLVFLNLTRYLTH